MKPFKIKVPLFIFIITILLSCKNEDQDNGKSENNKLLGEWQRSDATTMNEYKLYFNPENKGYSTDYIANEDSTAISALREFIWDTNENILTIDYADGEIETTPYSINANGQLIVPELTEFPFNKL